MSETKYEFDQDFQDLVAAHAVLDDDFLKRAGHLVKSEYFEDIDTAILVDTSLELFEQYGNAPAEVVLRKVLGEKVKSGDIRGEFSSSVQTKLDALMALDLSSKGYVEDQVAKFARNQAMIAAVVDSAELIEAGKLDEAANLVSEAANVGFTDTSEAYDYFEEIDSRTETRKGQESGDIAPRGISTGYAKIDKRLYHNGLGRGELTLIPGFLKAGKSTLVADWGLNAARGGNNVLGVTLEVNNEIYSNRMDSNISGAEVMNLKKDRDMVQRQIAEVRKSAGKFILHQYPTKTFSPRMLEQLMLQHRNKGLVFDLVIVDYLDIMMPDRYYRDDPIAEDTSIVEGLRRIAAEYDVAMLSPTQLNREGAKAAVGGAIHLANNIERGRIADLVISINKTEQEKENNEMRLHFAASRNQADGFTIKVKQDMARMRPITEFLDIEET